MERLDLDVKLVKVNYEKLAKVNAVGTRLSSTLLSHSCNTKVNKTIKQCRWR